MKLTDLKKTLETITSEQEDNVFYAPENIKVYSRSIKKIDNTLFFAGCAGKMKSLFLLSEKDEFPAAKFKGEVVEKNEAGMQLKRCPFKTENRKALQELFPFTKAVVLGLRNSFGFGDRIGQANAGHLQALEGYDFMPILAQQSIRELTRTNRTADEVMDAAVWAVFQEGYTKGFGADGDHLKTIQDIDMLVKAGYTQFTVDPGEYVNNDADILSEDKLKEILKSYPWDVLNDSIDEAKKRYLDKRITIDDFDIAADETGILKAYCKYGKCIAHVLALYNHLKNSYPGYDSEVEVSVDETDSVTSVFEHYFIASELRRLGVKFIGLAPRFIGDFEKGIDYKGDLDLFEREYIKHASIAAHFGYKISLHSGSDKFSVYKVIGKLKKGYVHVKTAGTSYLEALKVIAMKNPALFREILDFSRGLYEQEKRTYHVSADTAKIKPADGYKDAELLLLFDSVDARQILHVTFGRVLTEKNGAGNLRFKDDIVKCLEENEQLHYEVLVKHFHRHLEPFK
jgi:hypothetical protein